VIVWGYDKWFWFCKSYTQKSACAVINLQYLTAFICKWKPLKETKLCVFLTEFLTHICKLTSWYMIRCGGMSSRHCGIWLHGQWRCCRYNRRPSTCCCSTLYQCRGARSCTYWQSTRNPHYKLNQNMITSVHWNWRTWMNKLCEIWVSHGSKYENGCFLGCCAVYSRRNSTVFQRCLLPPSTGHRIK
jgi:hypothetical protein